MDPETFNESSVDQDSDSVDAQDSETGAINSDADEKLLKQIREDFRFCLDYWKDNREESALDMQFVSGNFWTRKEKEERAGRPCLDPDEISQYLKQANNNFRQAKRSIKVLPKGDGATDADALRREAIIRGIQYQSNAQAAYTTAYEQATSGGFGFFRIITKRMPSGSGFDVEPRIKRIPNPFTVLLDPQAKEADFSDQKICFVTDVMRIADFKRDYPKATKTSFDTNDHNMAPDWFKGDSIILAEYWVVEEKKRRKLKVKSAAGDTTVYEDELAKNDKPQILDHRDESKRKVVQYITNGVEILEENEWPGSWIPIIPILGEEIYVNDDGQSKRMFMSLVRRARVPQKMLCFIASQEAEEFGMAPRSPYFIWEGQEDADKKALEQINKVPRAYVRLKPVPGPNGELLPAPTRIAFTPNIEAYETAQENWRRKVQATMAGSPLPTDAQRVNDKSGIALDKIDESEAIGSYHFTDNANRALENGGRQLNELITVVMDTPRQVGIRKADDSHGVLHVMTQEHLQRFLENQAAGTSGTPGVAEAASPATAAPGSAGPGGLADAPGIAGPSAAAPNSQPNPDANLDYLIVDRGEFDVTISEGSSYQSQREEHSDFVDTLLKELPAMNFPPQTVQALVAKAVKMKDLGSWGDEIAAILDPTTGQGQQIAQLQQQLQQGQQAMADMQAEVQQLRLERAGKVLQSQAQIQMHREDNEVKLAIAEISTKAQATSERVEFIADLLQKMHISAHERGMQAVDHAHEHSIADKNAVIQQAAAQQQQAAQAQQDAQQPQPAQP
jgi:Phage P22-like portal protein